MIRYALILFMLSSVLRAAGVENKLSDEARKVIEGAETLVIYSLQPRDEVTADNKKETLFHKYRVLGQTEVSEKKARKEFFEALEKGIKENKGDVANCFIPRHGLRATLDGKTIDLVICFECFQILVYAGGDEHTTVLVTDSPQKIFDKTLKDAKVPLAPKAAK